MLAVRFTQAGARRIVDLQGLFEQQTAFLVGGAPSLLQQNVELLNQRGVLAMAMNNAAIHFRPSLWASGDNPNCYEPRILLDPRIMKFAPLAHADAIVGGQKYCTLPNLYFYLQAGNIPWEDFFAERAEVPWYNNTLFVGIHVLYQMGIRRIILAGSDFGFSSEGDVYAHKTALGSLEKKWNLDLYNSQVRELRMLKPMFDKAGCELLDCSQNSRIGQVYRTLSLDEAVQLCCKNFPAEARDPASLPHCSKFATESIQKRIAEWPGYQVVGAPGQNAMQEAL